MKFKIDKVFSRKSTSQTVKLTGENFISLRNLFTFGKANNAENLNKGYAENPFIFLIVNRIAEICSQLPRNYFNSKGEKVNSLPELESFLENPNYKENIQQTLYRLYANYLVCGETFAFRRKPESLNRYFVDVPTVPNVDILEDKDGTVKSYSYNYFTTRYTNIVSENVLHIYRPNITEDSNRGFSALNPGKKIYAFDNEMREAKAQIYKNRGASGIIHKKGTLALRESERKHLQQQYNNSTGGQNRDNVYVTDSEIGYIPLNLDGNLAKALSEDDLKNLRVACSLFNVSPLLFGDTSNSTYNNLEEAKEALYLDCILPLANTIDKPLFEWLITKSNVFYKLDEKRIKPLQRVNKELAETLVMEVNAGIITPEEARKIKYPNL